MKMTSFELILKDIINKDVSRGNAIKTREYILELLSHYDTVEIDLKDVNFTPSVADEIIGELANGLGADNFKRKIKILNASDSQKVLMRHVIGRRIQSRTHNNRSF